MRGRRQHCTVTKKFVIQPQKYTHMTPSFKLTTENTVIFSEIYFHFNFEKES